MPSPVGHAIAGAALARAITPKDTGLVVACAALAVAPDLDLVLPQNHRMATHSIGAVALVMILAILVTGRVMSPKWDGAWHRQDVVGARHRVVFALVAAFASHLLLDWLAVDNTPPRGIQLLWPFSDDWYISNWDLFRGTARRNVLTAQSMWINATAIAQEIVTLGPIAWVVWRLRQ